jgi:hypothetical protein
LGRQNIDGTSLNGETVTSKGTLGKEPEANPDREAFRIATHNLLWAVRDLKRSYEDPKNPPVVAQYTFLFANAERMERFLAGQGIHLDEGAVVDKEIETEEIESIIREAS